MKAISFTLDLFRDLSPEIRKQDEYIMGLCLDLLVTRNVQLLLRDPTLPLLYPADVYRDMGFEPMWPSSGVYYQLEPDGEEEFASIPRVWRMGSGDCDDLVCWRVAELRVRFNDPHAKVMYVGEMTSPDYIQYHVMVLRGDGVIEDPSLLLGMSDTPEMIKEELVSIGALPAT